MTAFEEALAGEMAVAKAYFLCSGTAALHVALDAVNLSAGDEVILPTYVCKHVFDAVVAAGGIPVLCDIGHAWTMTPETVGEKISPRSRAIILVGMFGLVESVESFRKFGIPIISDLAQCFDETLYSVNLARDIGDLIVCSFHAIKCLTTGTGGMVAAASAEWQSALHVSAMKFSSRYVGADICAALGLAQLARYEMFRRRRKELAEFYFSELPAPLTEVLGGVRHRWHGYRFPLSQSVFEFDIFAQRMLANGVTVRRGVDSLLHRQAGMPDACFPNALHAFEHTISIPIYPSLTDKESQLVVYACNCAWKLGE